MSWSPAIEPGCPDDVGTDAIKTLIIPRFAAEYSCASYRAWRFSGKIASRCGMVLPLQLCLTARRQISFRQALQQILMHVVLSIFERSSG